MELRYGVGHEKKRQHLLDELYDLSTSSRLILNFQI